MILRLRKDNNCDKRVHCSVSVFDKTALSDKSRRSLRAIRVKVLEQLAARLMHFSAIEPVQMHRGKNALHWFRVRGTICVLRRMQRTLLTDVARL